MNRRLAFSIAGLFAAGAATTNAMAQAKGPPADIAPKMQVCLACHVIEGKKTVGPTYKDVATKYAGQKDIEKELVTRVTKGSEPGKLKWGQVPMPPNPVSEGDAQKMVKWVLSLK